MASVIPNNQLMFDLILPSLTETGFNVVLVALTVLSAFLADQLFLVCRSGAAVHLDTAWWYSVHL